MINIPRLPEFSISFRTREKNSELFTVKTSSDIAQLCRECFEADKIEWVEQMIVIALSRSNRVLGITPTNNSNVKLNGEKVLGFFKVSSGGITGTVADPRIVMQFALLTNSTSIVLCHNHPSGSLQPSKADEELTNKIKQAALYHDIRLLDSLIISTESYFSFADAGLL